MRKSVEEFIPHEPGIPTNPAKWILVDKKHPEMKTPYGMETFKDKCIDQLRDLSILSEDTKSISAEVFHSAVSFVSTVGIDSEFAYISYNLLFPKHKVEVE